MSTLSAVRKTFSVAAPQLIGADYGTMSNEFWMFNQTGGFDYKFSYTGHNSSLKAFKKCGPFNSIIVKKAQAFTNGKTWIINKKGKAKEKESTGELASKIRRLMAKPNPFQSQKEFEAQQYIYTQLFGFCIVLPIKPVGFGNADATRLWNIPPCMLDYEETKRSWLLAQKQSDVVKKIVIVWDQERTEIPADDVFIIKDFLPSFSSPIFPETRVCSLEMNINNIIGAYESRNVLINYRGALGIISPDGKDVGGSIKLGDTDKEQLQQDFLQYGLKSTQWKFIISSANVKWSQMGVATRDLMLFEEIEDDIMRICDGYGYQYELMSSVKGVTFANKNEAKKILYQDTIIPEAESICEQWNKLFGLEELDIKIEKDFSKVPALQEDQQKLAQARKTRNEAMQIEFYNNLCTLNEWRVANGDDPLTNEYGEKYYWELINMGWKFGNGATFTISQNEQQGNNQSNQQQEEQEE